ncbi:MAG: aminotransferase class III-fold pyridoxal phosphate-dependent enzyme [Rhodospirillaceae bacterium]|nr:aminotransferase class III-fold pyridoxal phosphate-dependent enzyme [Rhodospirillaceae bacterium]
MLDIPNSNFLKENNAKQVWHPMAHPNEMEAIPPRIIVSGEGVRITDLEGTTVVDAVAGLWNVNLGYSCEPIKQAVASQLARLPYYAGFRGTTHPGIIELGYRLTEILKPEDMRRSMFTSGGSDSVESALRIARQYWKVRGKPDRTKFLSLKKGYHGTHFGGASVNGNSNFRRAYEPLMQGCFHVPAPFAYRNPFDETNPERLAELCLAALEDEIRFQDPETIAAFIAEPVQGAGGVIVPPPTYWPKLREVLDSYDILLIADEVVTAFGRTGNWFGSRGWGVKPDMICIAKAITSGYFPLGACVVNARIEEAFKSSNDMLGTIFHGYTYAGHPVGCAAALACMDETFRLDLPGNSRVEGDYLLTCLRTLEARHETVGSVRGKGLMLALEIVSDREEKTPAGPQYVSELAKLGYENGALVRVAGNIMILSPPLVITRADSDAIVGAIDAALSLNKLDPAT